MDMICKIALYIVGTGANRIPPKQNTVFNISFHTKFLIGNRFMKKNPSNDLQREYWNNWLLDNRNPIDPPAHIRLQTNKILDILNSLNLHQPRILDVGCGTGWLASNLIDYGKVIGTDIANRAIDIAKRHVPEADFFTGDFLTLDLGRRTFDVLVSMEVFSHVENKQEFLNNCFLHLKPGGYFIMTTQNRFVMERSGSDRISPPAPGKLSKWVNIRELKDLLMERFEIVALETINPTGYKGILRIVNSHKLSSLLSMLFSDSFIKNAKQTLGFGETIVVLARPRRLL